MHAETRFWEKVDTSGDCWLWEASTNGRYGVFWLHNKQGYAHRAAWEFESGPVPAGMCVLHRCDRTLCVRHDHLFLGTHADNMRDMFAKGRDRNGNNDKTQCSRGHPYDAKNTYYYETERHCRACRGEEQRVRRARRKNQQPRTR